MNSLRVPAGKASMKRMLALSILLLCSMASAQGKYRWGQKPTSQNPDDYSIKVHISATHFRTFCSGNSPCSNGVYLDAVLDGQNVELFGNLDKHQSEQIELGDLSRHAAAEAPLRRPGSRRPEVLCASAG